MKRTILIIFAHQSHIGMNAGGYVRLNELLQCQPEGVDSILFDINPTIYSKKNNSIIEFTLPKIIQYLPKQLFFLSIFIERIYVGFNLFRLGKKYISTNHVDVIYCPVGELLHLYLPAILLKRIYSDKKLVVDILNFTVKNNSLFSLYRQFKKQQISIFRSVLLSLVHKLSFELTKKTITYCDYIFTVSESLMHEIKMIYKKNSIDFTDSGVSLLINRKERLSSKYLGIYLGRLTEQKGIFSVINTFSKLILVYPDARFCLAGQADIVTQKVIEKTIKDAKLHLNIDVYYSVSEEKKIELLSQSSMFFHMASYEPLFPVIGILEAMKIGVPCVVFDMPVISSAHRKVLSEGLIIVKNGDFSGIVDSVEKYLNKSGSEKSKISKALTEFANNYSWPRILAKEWTQLTSLPKNKGRY